MKQIILNLVIICLFLCLNDNIYAQKNKEIPDIISQHTTNVSITVPKGFKKINEKQLSMKEISMVAPNKAYISNDSKADIFIKETPCPFNENDTDLMLKFYKSNLTSFFDRIEWKEEKIVKVKGHKFVRIVFISYTKPSKNNINRRRIISKYTIVYTKIIGEKKVNIVFTFPPQEKERWIKIAEKTMRSIRF